MLEIAAASLDSARAAEAGGADRIELCSALELGGLTPSHGLIAQVRERVRLPIHVLVRPRAGDFLYTDAECETMLRDIEACRALGVQGIVIGLLDAAGDVDMARCCELLAAAGSLAVTFHRAFDLARDPRRALEDVIALDAARVLSSGQAASAMAGAPLLAELVRAAGTRITVMPGAGIDAGNIAALAAATGAREFHASVRRRLASGMQRTNAALPEMTGGEWRSDVAAVRRLAAALHAAD